MSAALNLVLVAEGIELVEQARWLQRNGSQQGQGYLWSRPVELERAQQLLGSGVQRLLEPAGLSLVPSPDEVEGRTA